MKKQMIVCETTPYSFEASVRKALDNGWTVVVGTQVAKWKHIAGGGESYTPTQSSEGIFSIILEKEEV